MLLIMKSYQKLHYRRDKEQSLYYESKVPPTSGNLYVFSVPNNGMPGRDLELGFDNLLPMVCCNALIR